MLTSSRRDRRARLTALTALCLASAPWLACAPEEGEGPEPEASASSSDLPRTLGPAFKDLREIPAPGAAGSVTPFLSAAGDGDVLMSWQEPTDSGHALRMARFDGTAWSEPRTITRGDGFFVNWADFPSLVEMPGGSLAAHWLQREGPGTYAYGVRIVRSEDGGASWSEPITPHRDGTLTEHGFVSLFPADGALAAVWLDGRDFARAAADAADSQDSEEVPHADMSLRYAEIDGDGRIRAEALIDGRTCDCCQTAVALSARGPVVVYRDRSDAEIRDISVVRWLDGRWSAPAVLHADGWYIPACPVNGPAISAAGERLAVAWYTAANDDPRVLVAFSPDAGAAFGPPLRVDEGDPMGRVDVAVLPDGSALVLWLEASEEGARVMARWIRPDGATSHAETVALTDVSRASGFPRMARRGTEVVFAWTDTAGEGSLRTAVATLPAESGPGE